jgi:hypothetical protein
LFTSYYTHNYLLSTRMSVNTTQTFRDSQSLIHSIELSQNISIRINVYTEEYYSRNKFQMKYYNIHRELRYSGQEFFYIFLSDATHILYRKTYLYIHTTHFYSTRVWDKLLSKHSPLLTYFYLRTLKYCDWVGRFACKACVKKIWFRTIGSNAIYNIVQH